MKFGLLDLPTLCLCDHVHVSFGFRKFEQFHLTCGAFPLMQFQLFSQVFSWCVEFFQFFLSLFYFFSCYLPMECPSFGHSTSYNFYFSLFCRHKFDQEPQSVFLSLSLQFRTWLLFHLIICWLDLSAELPFIFCSCCSFSGACSRLYRALRIISSISLFFHSRVFLCSELFLILFCSCVSTPCFEIEKLLAIHA